MGVRKIVRIDEEKCDGCGLCVPSCAEGAIRIIDGKARLFAENLCDGLGACLGECPQGAITVEEREAEPFDERAVHDHLAVPTDESGAPAVAAPLPSPETPALAPQMASLTAPALSRQAPARQAPAPQAAPFGGCPGSRVMQFGPAAAGATYSAPRSAARSDTPGNGGEPRASELTQWPVQLHLVPPTAPYFQGADVLLAADCTAFAVGDFHRSFLRGRALAVACPKLDQAQERYLEKLVTMIDEARIGTLTVAVMEVPCCGGLARLAQEAAARARRKVPVKRVVIGVRGQVLEESWL
jgi:NAD-dependent dihydropyrimidine dehydrogenase PreA subunit